jgi:2-C-methyl-D-erythritol 4-phosphate cytidylyltransferase/2-C-methyl-D-erythritol 2,4-cyclodiphosphate synthase
VSELGAVLVAGGDSQRMGTDTAWIDLWGRPVWRWSADALLSIPELEHLAVVVPPDSIGRFRAALPEKGTDRCIVVAGGPGRSDSVLAGLTALANAGVSSGGLVIVHDAARPGLTPDLIRAVADAARATGAAIATVPVADTLKRETDGRVDLTIDRTKLVSAQTPQAASLGILRAALEAARARGDAPTDEAAALAAIGVPVAAVPGDLANSTLAGPSNEHVMRGMLRERVGPLAGPTLAAGGRSGIGFDAHRLEAGRPLMLGGIAWPEEPRGLAGHSDGDVALHAVIDALLGAAGLGDIGGFFPADDPAWTDADSADLVRKTVLAVRAAGWAPTGVDCVIAAERPRIDARRSELEGRIAELIGLPLELVSVKGTTSDGLGLTGGEGIAAWAVAVVAHGS